ncbi:subtilisin SUB8 [Toxoplasma gondii p89]|uniref:subtilisin n=4 Tax=Toxoplasma gondii TaxID=5811 RepID=A0A086JKG5_TOXGO|nr:subtilisin SUB8 [Toxoplasma gondii FOU]KFG37028.1 subtilisin SUB8 [Toxoplasma gondii p89]PUA84824.1 subtilisin SUB8 [Toxoplasma gondii TgCATBr9]RQX70175.1 subtilisin SUB8 [Toxoplasma gondii CAST]
MNLRSDDSDIDPAVSNRISGRRGEARSLGLPTREVNYGRTGGQSSSTLGGSLRVQGVSALPLSAFEVHAIESKDDWQPRSSQEGPSHQDVSLDASSPMQKLHRLVGDASELQDAASRPASDDTLNNEKRNSVPLLPGKRAGDANFLSEPRGVATNNSPSSQPDTSRVNSATANQPKRKTTKARNSVPDSGQSSPRGQMVVVNVEALGSPIDKDTGRPLFYNDRILVGWRCSDHELLALKALEMEEEEEEDDVPQGSSLSAPASMDDPNASITDEKPQVGIPCAQSGFDPLTLGASQSEIRLCGYVPPDLGIDIRSLRDSRQTTSSASASSNPAVPLDLSQVSALWPNTRRPRNNNENSAHFGNFNRHGNMSPADSPSAVFASSDNSKRRTSTPGQPGLSDGMVGAPPRRLQVLDRMLKSYASPEVESVKTLFRRLPQKRSLRKKVPHGETWKRPESQVDNQETLSASDAQKNNSNSGLGISSKDMAEERQSLGLSSGNHATSKGATRPSKGNLDRSGGTVYSEHTRSPGTGDNLEGGRAGKNIRDSVTEDSKTEEFVKKRLLDDDELCGMDLIKLSLKHYRARVEGTRYDGYPENNSENVEALKAFMKEFASHDYVGDILFLAPDAPIHAHATSPELNGEASPTDGEECTSASCTSKHPTEIGNKEEQARSAFRVNPPQPPALAPDDRDSVQRSNSNVNKTVKISEYPNGSADKQQSIFLKRTLNSDNSKNLDFWAVNGFGPYPTSAPGDKRAEKVSQDEDGVAEEPFRVGKPSVPEQTIHAVSSNRLLQETLQVSESGKEESGRTVFPNDPLFSLQWSLGSPPQDVQMSAEFCFLRAREELQGRSADADERGEGGSFQQTPNKSQLAKVRQLCEAAGHKDKYATGGKLRATTLAAEVEDGQGDTDQHKKDGITPDSASTLQAEANEAQLQDLEGDMEERQTTPSLQESAELHVLQGSHAGRGGGTQIGENAADANSIDMVKAWRLSLSPQDEDNRKKQEVLVAVIDTGVNYIHSDLANSIWVNEQELNGIPGFDDDQNGYIDDVYGWNFLHGNNNPMDDNGHGSHVAGIIGAQRNNNQGVSGISSHARIIALKILNKKGEGDVSHAIPAIRYALDNGAKVITNSWGGISGTQILGVLLKEAVADASGSVFVIAAGNDGMDISKDPYYPASFLRDWTITVAAHARDGALPKWSNYGHNTVHLTAPGENITSTWMGSGYRLSSGTSMAAPMVSGVAAEILAYNPMLQPQQVVDVLVQSAITDKRHANVSLTGARLNAYRAIILSQLQFVSLSPAELHVGGTVDPVGEVEMIFRSLMLPPGVYEGTIELVYSRRLASTRGLGMLSGVLKRRIVQLVQVTLPVKLTIIQ